MPRWKVENRWLIEKEKIRASAGGVFRKEKTLKKIRALVGAKIPQATSNAME